MRQLNKAANMVRGRKGILRQSTNKPERYAATAVTVVAAAVTLRAFYLVIQQLPHHTFSTFKGASTRSKTSVFCIIRIILDV